MISNSMFSRMKCMTGTPFSEVKSATIAVEFFGKESATLSYFSMEIEINMKPKFP